MRGVLEFITGLGSDGDLSGQLTTEHDFLLDPSTYHARSTASFWGPGALVEDFRFTL